jgi:hypothetical protein
MFPSSIERLGFTGVRSLTKPWLRAYELRVIMFMPTASPVVYAYMTWHMEPTTWVSISRSFACFESPSTGELPSHSRIAGTWSSIQRANVVASPVSENRNAEARVMRSCSTCVRKPPDSPATRAPR